MAGKNFSVLGFPSNDFGGQEPGTATEIAEFCKRTYDVDFPMFSKVVTKPGDAQSPIYKFLGTSGNLPKWNFSKYVVDKNGKIVAFFDSKVKPTRLSSWTRLRSDVRVAFPQLGDLLTHAGVCYTASMGKDSLSITDNRTGKTYEVLLIDGNIRARDLKQIQKDPDDFGVMSYDPAFMNTASCQSKITFIDGDKGILRYRGYPIEQLAEKCTFLEVAYLLVYGELPTEDQMREWSDGIKYHTMIPEYTKKSMEGFRYDAHPMGMMVSQAAALSTAYPDAKDISDPASRRLQTIRLIAKMPTIAAYAYRHGLGLPYVYPDNDLSYTATSSA